MVHDTSKIILCFDLFAFNCSWKCSAEDTPSRQLHGACGKNPEIGNYLFLKFIICCTNHLETTYVGIKLQWQIKEEEGLKAFLEAKLKSIPQQILESDRNKLNEIASTVSVLPKQIESHLVKFQHEVCMIVAEKIEVLMTDSQHCCPRIENLLGYLFCFSFSF